MKLEGNPRDKELLSSIFRSIHSIKGACGFWGFQKLEKLAHVGESLVSKLRDRRLQLSAKIGSALRESGDWIRKMWAALEKDDQRAARARSASCAPPQAKERIQELAESSGARSSSAAPEARDTPEDGRARTAPKDSTIRVNVPVLDRWVLARKQLLQFAE